jgi:hypothetical protein
VTRCWGSVAADGDGVEFLCNATGLLDFARNKLTKILQVNVSRHELREGIYHYDDWLAKIVILHAGCSPEATRASHVAAVGCRSGAIGRHYRIPLHKRVVRA